MKTLYLFLLLPFFISGQSVVSVDDAQKMIEDGTIMVDVRENDEVAKLGYFVDGSILQIPLSQLSERHSEIPKEKSLIIACRSGNRSAQAIEELQEFGFTNLINLEGGMNEWQAKGYPVIVDGVKPNVKSCHGTKGASCCKKGDAKSASCCSGNSKGKQCSKDKTGTGCKKKHS